MSTFEGDNTTFKQRVLAANIVWKQRPHNTEDDSSSQGSMAEPQQTIEKVPEFENYEKWRETALADVGQTGKLSMLLAKVMYKNDWEVLWEKEQKSEER